MVSDVIKSFKEKLNEKFQEGVDDSAQVPQLKFLSFPGSGVSLIENTIYLVLFSCRQEQSLTGGVPYQVHHASEHDADVGLRKPPLYLSLNLLLIFNLNYYANCLEYYEKVIQELYSWTFFEFKDPHNNEVTKRHVDIMMSNFSAREEIEIWNSFNVTGAPLLRYELNYLEIEPTKNIKDKVKVAKALNPAVAPDENISPQDIAGSENEQQTSTENSEAGGVGFTTTLLPILKAQIDLITSQVNQFTVFQGSHEQALKANWSLLCSRLKDICFEYERISRLLSEEGKNTFLSGSEKQALKEFSQNILQVQKALPKHDNTMPASGTYTAIYDGWCQSLTRFNSINTSQYFMNQLQILTRRLL